MGLSGTIHALFCKVSEGVTRTPAWVLWILKLVPPELLPQRHFLYLPGCGMW